MSFAARNWVVWLIMLFMLWLHSSTWHYAFDRSAPMLFGFMPWAFYWHLIYGFIIATVAVLVVEKVAWPDPPAELLERAPGYEEREDG